VEEHVGNPVMAIILTGFTLIAVSTMALFTWLFVDWLFPPEAFVLKILTLIFFDISAFFWGCMHLFGTPASKSSDQIISAGMIVDLILSICTTIAYFTIAYVLRFEPGFPVRNLVVTMDILVTFAVVYNAVLFMAYFSTEWRIRHPRKYLFAEVAPVYSPPRRAAQVAIIEEEPEQLPPPRANKPNKNSELSTNKMDSPDYSPEEEEFEDAPAANKKKVRPLPKSRKQE